MKVEWTLSNPTILHGKSYACFIIWYYAHKAPVFPNLPNDISIYILDFILLSYDPYHGHDSSQMFSSFYKL